MGLNRVIAIKNYHCELKRINFPVASLHIPSSLRLGEVYPLYLS